jgi:hypothetical protein
MRERQRGAASESKVDFFFLGRGAGLACLARRFGAIGETHRRGA